MHGLLHNRTRTGNGIENCSTHEKRQGCSRKQENQLNFYELLTVKLLRLKV